MGKQLVNILNAALILSLLTSQASAHYVGRLSHDLSKKRCPSSVNQVDCRHLFNEDTVADNGDYLNDLAQLEDQVIAKQAESFKYGNSQKYADQELEAIRKEIDAALELSPGEAADKITKLQKRLSNVGLKLNMKEAAARVDDILENPDALRSGQKFFLSPDRKNNYTVNFEVEALDALLAAERHIVQKFVTSLKMSYIGDMIDPTRFRYLDGAIQGSKGKGFEVAIVSRGHQRLIGCVKDGVHTILKYDPHSPETKNGFMVRYKDLCK